MVGFGITAFLQMGEPMLSTPHIWYSHFKLWSDFRPWILASEHDAKSILPLFPISVSVYSSHIALILFPYSSIIFGKFLDSCADNPTLAIVIPVIVASFHASPSLMPTKETQSSWSPPRYKHYDEENINWEFRISFNKIN